MTDILVYTEEQGNVIAGSVQPDRMVVAVLGAVSVGGNEAVSSVNGQIGAVVLDAADVGADAAGTSAAAVGTHEAAADPHPQYTTAAEAAAAAPVQSVNGETGVVVLSATDVGADVAGTAAAAVAAHEAALDPHPQYLTQTDGDARYERGLTAGANITIDRTDPDNPVISSESGGDVTSVNGQTGVVVLDTDDVAEGVSNLYFTNARASAAAPVQSVNGQTGAVDLSGSYAPLSHVGSGGTAHANVVAGGAAGFMTGTDKTKLDGIAVGAQANVPTDLSLGTVTNTTIPLNSSTGTDVTLPAATTSTAGLLSGTDKTKLDSVQAGAVASAQVVGYAGTAKTLALTDINTIIDCTSGSAVTITIPPQSSVTWTADAEIHVRMSGTGVVSIAVGAGVTVPPLTAPVALAGQGAMVTLKRRSSDVWAVVGLSNIESVVRATPLTDLSTASDAAVVAADTVLQAFGKLQAQATHVEITSALGV